MGVKRFLWNLPVLGPKMFSPQKHYFCDSAFFWWKKKVVDFGVVHSFSCSARIVCLKVTPKILHLNLNIAVNNVHRISTIVDHIRQSTHEIEQVDDQHPLSARDIFAQLPRRLGADPPPVSGFGWMRKYEPCLKTSKYLQLQTFACSPLHRGHFL